MADDVKVPREVLEHWLEYWNGNRNDKAMWDALHHILDEVETLLAAAPAEGKPVALEYPACPKCCAVGPCSDRLCEYPKSDTPTTDLAEHWAGSKKVVSADIARKLEKAARSHPAPPLPEGNTVPCVVAPMTDAMSDTPDWWNLVDRALKMMQMAGYRVAEVNPDHNNPIIAWMADARAALAAAPPSPQAAQDFVCLQEPRCKSPCGGRNCHVAPPSHTDASREMDTQRRIYEAVADAVNEVAEEVSAAFLQAGLTPGEWDGDNIVQDVKRGIANDIERLAATAKEPPSAIGPTREKLVEDAGDITKIDDDLYADRVGLHRLFDAMEAKLEAKRAQGRGGWNNDCTVEFLERLLKEHIDKPWTPRNLVDMANFCMMIWNRHLPNASTDDTNNKPALAQQEGG